MSPRQNLWLTLVLWLVVMGLAATLSLRHTMQWDWTAGQRNTLTAPSRELLRTLPEPIEATAYVFPDAETRKDISARFAPYQREKANFTLAFVDPSEAPQLIRELGVRNSGEVLIRYQGRSEKLTTLSEPQISSALQRLAYADNALLVFLAGHGERDPLDDSESGYSQLAANLQDKGLDIRSWTLANGPLPAETRLLILASPRQSLLPGELANLVTFLEKGGRLLWLSDPGAPALPELSKALGVLPQVGTMIYQDYELLGSSHPALALVASYPDHPVTARMDAMTAFPFASAIGVASQTNWETTALLRSVDRSWLELGPLEGNLSFEADIDLKGPLPIGLALTRGDNQRAAVIMDSDFAANSYLPQLGNQSFAVALIQWLVGRDGQMHIDLPAAPDAQLQISPGGVRLLGLFFALLLPALLLIGGLWNWRRRRQSR